MLKNINFEIPTQPMVRIMMGMVKPEDIETVKSTSEDIHLAEGVYKINSLNPEHILTANGIKLKNSFWNPRSEALKNASKDLKNGTLDWDKIDQETKRIADECGLDEDFETYGVCDNYEQILKMMPYLATSKYHHIITLAPIYKADQSPNGGWRWHKWGEYIGNHEIKYEYLYDEEDIDVVYVYHIHTIKEDE